MGFLPTENKKGSVRFYRDGHTDRVAEEHSHIPHLEETRLIYLFSPLDNRENLVSNRKA